MSVYILLFCFFNRFDSSEHSKIEFDHASTTSDNNLQRHGSPCGSHSACPALLLRTFFSRSLVLASSDSSISAAAVCPASTCSREPRSRFRWRHEYTSQCDRKNHSSELFECCGMVSSLRNIETDYLWGARYGSSRLDSVHRLLSL